MFCVKWKRATVGNEKVGENQIYEELTDRRAAADAAEDKVLVSHLEMDFLAFSFYSSPSAQGRNFFLLRVVVKSDF